MKTNRILLFLLIFATHYASGGSRIEYSINEAWKFQKDVQPNSWQADVDDSEWEIVSFPHSWNAFDINDDVPGYFRGTSIYRRDIFIDENKKNLSSYIHFEGANQVVKLYVNGTYVGEHIGGYTAFSFDISKLIKYGEENLFAIEVDNSHNPDIPPLSADFTFFGGIYRDVYLKFVDPVHISMNDFGSSGVYISTPKVTDANADVEIATILSNAHNKNQTVRVEHEFRSPKGDIVSSYRSDVKLAANATIKSYQKKIKIKNPILWDIDAPNRYAVYTRVYDKKSNVLLDEIMTHIGFRYFHFDPDLGFFLNGKKVKLVGTNRHQDYFNKANALTDPMHIRDLMLLKKMGGNFLRVAHYPQDPVVLDMCDKLGIITSVEIPVVNAITESDAFLENSLHMVREMIRQSYNHPSVVMWAYMNEVLLRKPFSEKERLKEYYINVEHTAKVLEAAVREEDPYRYTMMAFHNDLKSYEAANLTQIPMIQGWNLYQGWYEPDINEFQKLLDSFHAKYPEKILLVTEYGPGVDPRLHSYDSERFDFSQEYGLKYHQHYLQEIMKRDFMAGSTVWNLNDFYSESRGDAVPHVNNKGLTGLDREIKDVYLYYQTALSKEPLVWIGQREWKARGGTAKKGEKAARQTVPIFANVAEVEMFVNDKSLGVQEVENFAAYFDVDFVDGNNQIRVEGVSENKQIVDLLDVWFDVTPSDFKNSSGDFINLNVMLGSHRYFDDRVANVAWIPEQPYMKGGWGYIGGEPYRRTTNFGSLLGTDANILRTDNDPLFQTQREGIESFKADVPDGNYSIYFHWAELESDKEAEKLLYNLGADAVKEDVSGRIFDVNVNNVLYFKDLNLMESYGSQTAVIKKVNINVQNGEGIHINFIDKVGKPVLNAIQIIGN